MEGSQAVRKRTNSGRKLLYRLLGGGLVLGLIKPIIRYPKELVKPPVKVVAANCLWKALRPRPRYWEKYWKTGVEAWISRHVELYYITTCQGFHIAGCSYDTYVGLRQ